MLAHAGTPDEQVALLMVVAGLWVGWAGLSRLRGRGFPRLSLASAWVLSGLGVVDRGRGSHPPPPVHASEPRERHTGRGAPRVDRHALYPTADGG